MWVNGVSFGQKDPQFQLDVSFYAFDLLYRDGERLTGQPLEKIQLETERDRYMSAEDAKAYGLIDEVLHEDGQMVGLLTGDDPAHEEQRGALIEAVIDGGASLNDAISYPSTLMPKRLAVIGV